MPFLTPFTFYLYFTIRLHLRCYSFDKTHFGNDEQWFNWVYEFGMKTEKPTYHRWKLLDRYRLGQVPGLIHITSTHECNVIGDQLQRDD